MIYRVSGECFWINVVVKTRNALQEIYDEKERGWKICCRCCRRRCSIAVAARWRRLQTDRRQRRRSFRFQVHEFRGVTLRVLVVGGPRQTSVFSQTLVVRAPALPHRDCRLVLPSVVIIIIIIIIQNLYSAIMPLGGYRKKAGPSW